MLSRIAADAVALVHLGFILFVVFGGLLVLRRPALKWVHLPAALWGVLIEFGGWVCPLTRYENLFRARAGVAGYGGGFVQHYVIALIYPAGLTRGIELALGFTVLAVNLSIYVYAFSRHTAAPGQDDR
jgi:hypothetical protein